MSRVIHAAAFTAAISAVACGATTRDPGAVQTQPAQTGPVQVQSDTRGQIPAGQQLDVRLQSTLSSGTAKPERVTSRSPSPSASHVTQWPASSSGVAHFSHCRTMGFLRGSSAWPAAAGRGRMIAPARRARRFELGIARRPR